MAGLAAIELGQGFLPALFVSYLVTVWLVNQVFKGDDFGPGGGAENSPEEDVRVLHLFGALGVA